jgi:hypothetical protein
MDMAKILKSKKFKVIPTCYVESSSNGRCLWQMMEGSRHLVHITLYSISAKNHANVRGQGVAPDSILDVAVNVNLPGPHGLEFVSYIQLPTLVPKPCLKPRHKLASINEGRTGRTGCPPFTACDLALPVGGTSMSNIHIIHLVCIG